MNTFRQSMVRAPDAGPNYAKLMEEYFSRKEASLPTRIEIKGERYPKSKVPEDEKNKVPEGKEPPLEDFKVLKHAYDLFEEFKGLIADMIYSISERDKSRELFLQISCTDALRVLEVELNFIYEVFYTKVSVVRNRLGYFLRFVSFSSVVVAMALFTLYHKRGLMKFDIIVTYTLLYGALALDLITFLMLIFSDRTFVLSKKSEKKSFIGTIRNAFIGIIMVPHLWIMRPEWSKCKKSFTRCSRLSTRFVFRRWSGSMSGHNFIIYCLDQCQNAPPINAKDHMVSKVITLVWFKTKKFQKSAFNKVVNYFGAKDLVDIWKYKEKNPFLKELWQFIFDELKKKSEKAVDVEFTKKICSARGEYIWAVISNELKKKPKESKDEKSGDVNLGDKVMASVISNDLKKKPKESEDEKSGDVNWGDKVMAYVDSNKVAFDESLMLWHIATHLCFEEDKKDCDERHFSKLISDYMLYLLIMQPTMMSSIAGIGQIRFQDTCEEVIKFFSKRDLDTREEDNANKESRGKKTRQERREEKKEKIVKAACKKLLDVDTDIESVAVKGDRSKSVLFDAWILAKLLRKLPDELKWKSIAQIWVEILSYAASNCRPTTHVQQVSKGGELVSFVWLLMVHLGLGAQFQIKEGHARAKLIVGKDLE